MFDDEAAVDLGADPDDLEVLIEGGIDDRANDIDENQDNVEGNQPDPEGTPEQPKKRVVKRPQPKLDPERLKGPRGVATLEHVFKDFKFHGKGYEKHDLNRMMKQLEHWAHRLYPRFQFDDCLEKIEKLGHKKPVGTLVKRIRMGLETGDELVLRADDDDDDEGADADKLPNLSAEAAAESPLDAFDALLSQQLSEARARTPMPTPQQSQPPQVLSEEQRERMLRNRQLAEERRLARAKMQQNMNLQQPTEENVSNQDLSFGGGTVCDLMTEGAIQHSVSHATVNSDSLLYQETSHHCSDQDRDMFGTDCLNHSKAQKKEDTDVANVFGDNIHVEDLTTDADNVGSELLPGSVLSASCADKSNVDIEPCKANDDNPEELAVGHRSPEEHVENSTLGGENLNTASQLGKEV